MADDKAENFVRCLLRDIVGCFCVAMKLKIEIPPELEEDRCVPKYFFTEIIEISKPFINELMDDITIMPVLLYSSDNFFKRFTHSVCLKLSEGEEDEQISFLKVTAFLVMLLATLFVNVCYRSFDDIPGIYYRMLKDHLSTKFYVEGEFDEITLKCRELKDDEEWKSESVDEMRKYIMESCDRELAANEISPDSFEQETCELRILDLRKQPKPSDSDTYKCQLCGIDCLVLLKVFFQPRVKSKPECEQI
ncbi:hypothetical protein HNY73_017602 [Argiope bruennichi]|uniref:Uncharacterized protein n=1 Tax=Argiope bruennichi TaxID=94029 RepID=A0A8T0EF25_ARGBR|nr:hypothetical protein HNY73_017602 [Argiope bruennichi]